VSIGKNDKEALTERFCRLLTKPKKNWSHVALEIAGSLEKTGIDGCEERLLGVFDLVLPFSNARGSTVSEFLASSNKIAAKDSFKNLVEKAKLNQSVHEGDFGWMWLRCAYCNLLSKSGSAKVKEKFFDVLQNTAHVDSFVNAAEALAGESMVLAGKGINEKYRFEFYNLLCTPEGNRLLFGCNLDGEIFSGYSSLDKSKVGQYILYYKGLAALVGAYGGCEFDVKFDVVAARELSPNKARLMQEWAAANDEKFMAAAASNGAEKTLRALKKMLGMEKNYPPAISAVKDAISKIESRIANRNTRVANVVAMIEKHAKSREIAVQKQKLKN